MAKPKPSANELVIREIEWSYNKNSSRVASIIEVYDLHLKPAGQGQISPTAQDVLRAGVVLLHAAIEDLLRQSRISFFPLDDDKKLDSIPLLSDRNKRPDKFGFGSLISYQKMSVYDLITQSIKEYYENYGSISTIHDLTSCIKDCRIIDLEHNFEILKNLIARRHLIVHKGDADREAKGKGNHKVRRIKAVDLREFKDDADAFAKSFIAKLREVHAK